MSRSTHQIATSHSTAPADHTPIHPRRDDAPKTNDLVGDSPPYSPSSKNAMLSKGHCQILKWIRNLDLNVNGPYNFLRIVPDITVKPAEFPRRFKPNAGAIAADYIEHGLQRGFISLEDLEEFAVDHDIDIRDRCPPALKNTCRRRRRCEMKALIVRSKRRYRYTADMLKNQIQRLQHRLDKRKLAGRKFMRYCRSQSERVNRGSPHMHCWLQGQEQLQIRQLGSDRRFSFD
jgi:hypothetical protein